MTRTEGTERARCQKARASKTCLKTGSARFAERERRCFDPSQDPVLWRPRARGAEHPWAAQESQTMRIGLDTPCPVSKLGIIPINNRPGFFEL